MNGRARYARIRRCAGATPHVFGNASACRGHGMGPPQYRETGGAFIQLSDRGDEVVVRWMVSSFSFARAGCRYSARSSFTDANGVYGRGPYLHLENLTRVRGHQLCACPAPCRQAKTPAAPVPSQYQFGFRRTGRQMELSQMLRCRPLPASSSPLSMELVPVLLGRPSVRFVDHWVDSTESPSPSEEDPLPMVGHSA